VRTAGDWERGNLEREDDFRIRWGWAQADRLETGFTAVVRVKNEAASIPFVLPPLLAAAERVVLVDNDSSDGTPELAMETAAAAGATDRFELLTYPFSVSRCGPEHLATPADSVHSLTYFYNWAFSHVRTTYALKWDGDMVLTDVGIDGLRALAWQLESAECIVTMLRCPLYVADERTAFLDLSLVNREPWAWPNREGYEHTKAFEWEQLLWPRTLPVLSLPDWSCVELKHLNEDEFDHWSSEDFDTSTRTHRKRREWEVFRALVDNEELPLGVQRIDAPDERHVVDYVRAEWIPHNEDELRRLQRNALVRMAVTDTRDRARSLVKRWVGGRAGSAAMRSAS
jgi:glycosyltransferase involved in cell wall biosynthesis